MGFEIKERLSGVTALKHAGMVWQCWVVETGPLPGEQHYEWRSPCSRLRVRRADSFERWTAIVEGKSIGDWFGTSQLAMAAAAAVRLTERSQERSAPARLNAEKSEAA